MRVYDFCLIFICGVIILCIFFCLSSTLVPANAGGASDVRRAQEMASTDDQKEGYRLCHNDNHRWKNVSSWTYRLDYYIGKSLLQSPPRQSWIFRPESMANILIITEETKEKVDHIHVKDLLPYVPLRLKSPLYIYPLDRVEAFHTPVLCKTRPVHNYGFSVLLRINSQRHWSPIYEQKKYNKIPFRSKIPKIVWRGAPTGYGFNNNIPYRSVSREKILQYQDRYDFLDIGLTKLLPNTDTVFKKYIRDTKTMETMSEYKYLLIIEGNDVASGLKWSMASSSVVMMPIPQIASWFMEDHLEPFVHFIPVRDDFTDIAERFQWAETHADKCKEIIKNANEFVTFFSDDAYELKMNEAVMTWYTNNISYAISS